MHCVPSVLWRCWLYGRKGIRPVKTEWWGTGMVICLERGANALHIVQLMPLPPHHLLLIKIQSWFTFLVPALHECVCMCSYVCGGACCKLLHPCTLLYVYFILCIYRSECIRQVTEGSRDAICRQAGSHSLQRLCRLFHQTENHDE